ncbi:HET-domain-containing protein, partial [Stipitochalara longipes BDJ]
MNNLLRDEIFSESVLNTVRTWITQCQARHRICSRQRGAGLGIPRLPTRLLDLGTNGSTAWKVVETCQKREPYSKYAALSHRWTSNVPKLEGDNVATLKFGVGDHIVPQYYRDVFRLTRALGIRFLWIDSLCIQQDSEKDWTTEAVTMNDVYSNAFCTFSLCWQSEKSGISPCKGPRLKLKTKQTLSRWLLPGQNTNATVTLDNIWDSSVTNSFLNQRGWVLQERVMSKRILYLGNEQLFWECDESTACEMAPYQVPNPQIFGPATEYSGSLIESSFPRPCADFTSVSNTTNNAIVFWRKIIEKYSKTDLTFEVDRLVAISAIASLVALETRDEYLAGLWKEQLIQQLLWIVGKKSKSLPTKEENKFEYIAPTWSWASFRG